MHGIIINSIKNALITIVWTADLEPTNTREHREIGQTAQAKQNTTKGIDSAGCQVK